MIVERIVGTLKFAVDTSEKNSLFLPSDVAEKTGASINNILEYFYYVDKMYKPMVGTIELTSRCNFNCPFCYIHKEGEGTELDIAKILNWIDWLISKGLVKCTLTGGECTIYKNFIEVYKYLKERGVIVSVFTNASMITDELIEIFDKWPPSMIEVSIYGINNKAFKETTKQSKYTATNILNNILRLSKHGHNVRCKTQVNRYTIEEEPGIEKWCKQNEIAYYTSSIQKDTYWNETTEHLEVDRKVDYFCTKQISSEVKKKINFNCGAGKFGFYIDSCGVLRPCWNFYSCTDGCFDIQKEGIEKAFELMQLFIDKYKGKTLFGCKGCKAHSICNECIAEQLKKSKKQLEKKCEDTQHIYNQLINKE